MVDQRERGKRGEKLMREETEERGEGSGDMEERKEEEAKTRCRVGRKK